MDFTTTRQKWTELLALYFGQLDSAPKPTLEATRSRIRRLYDQAHAAAVPLQRPALPDPIFSDMEFAAIADVVDIAGECDPPSQWEMRERRRAQLREAQRRYRAKTAAAYGRTYKSRTRAYKPPGAPCWCGCGQKANIGSKYVRGHAGKVIRWFRWIERAFRGWTRERLPKALLERLRWVPCRHCGGWMPTTDLLGNPMSGLGFDCQMRLRKAQHGVKSKGGRKDYGKISYRVQAFWQEARLQDAMKPAGGDRPREPKEKEDVPVESRPETDTESTRD